MDKKMATNSNNKPRDKSSLVILSVVIIFVISAAILAMGAVPQIFRTATDVNNTNILLQQRIAISEQQEYEDMARDAQAVKIISHVDIQLKSLKDNITQLMMDSEKRSNASKAQRDVLDNKLDINTAQNTKILANLDNKSKDHARQSADMRILANKIAHISNDTRDALIIYGENSVSKFDKILENQINLSTKIVENQIKISNKLDILLNNTN